MKIWDYDLLLIDISKRLFLYDLKLGAKNYKHMSEGGSNAFQQRREEIRVATKVCLFCLSL